MSDFDRKFYGNAPRIVDTPCGEKAVLDGIGYRCQGCFAILGSVGCPCTREENDNQRRGSE